jgi:hypothetical protein
MKPHIQAQIDEMADMTIGQLRDEYARVFGEPTRSRHKVFLRKRITWGLQARDEGGLSERARRRAEELARDTDLRLLAPKSHTEVRPFRPTRDRRLPLPGAVITREYRGETIAVTVLDAGFEYHGKVYRSLSAVAKDVTGSHWNGYGFFGIAKKETA